ncbi:MAG: molecular chaperone TorD family protein [Gammaproteobacteria bacterium]|nr:molecular chaperone TorD family protein [Gammaproteobacteria bacterium]
MPQAQVLTSKTAIDADNNQVVAGWHENPVTEEQQYRAAAYGMLAALLRSAPDVTLIEQVNGFSGVDDGGDEMAVSMSLLGLATENCPQSGIATEFHDLFIGLGRGELLPYGSFYLTGFLMEKPLGDLRDDLDRLGFEREADVHEPEDHIAALCEVMVMLIQEGCSTAVQQDFYNKHIGSWQQKFFADLAVAENAVFYRAVARFAAAFMNLEARYLAAG